MNSPFDPPNADDHSNADPASIRNASAFPARPPTPDINQQLVQQELHLRNRAIGDFQRRLFELTPRVVVTRAIVAVNVVVFLLMAISAGTLLSPGHEMLVAWGSNLGASTLDGQWWRLLTCMFVHIGIIHIAFNMYILWDAGHLVERLVGNVGFLVLYIISGLSGSVASVYWNPYVNSAGASGAVFGVFGALMGFIMLRGDSVPKSILARLRSSGLTFLALNLAIGFSIRWIDNAAHIGGLAAGFVCGVLMSYPLDRANKTSRAMRNLLTAAVGAVALFAAVHSAPEPPVDVAATEQEVLDSYHDGLRRLERGEITNDEFAEIVESKVLPGWRTVRRALDERPESSPRRQRLLKQYAKAREEEWEAHVARLRDPTNANISEHEKKREVLSQLIEELTPQ